MGTRAVLLTMFGFMMTLNMSRPAVPLFASGLGAGTLEIGILTAAYALLPLLLAIQAGRLVDRFGDRLPVLVGSLGCAAGMALPYAVPALWALLVSQILVGVSHLLIAVSLQNVLGNTAQSKEQRDHYFSMLSMTVALAGFFGPVVQGYLAEWTSYSFVFLVSSLLCAVPVLLSKFIPVVRVRGEQQEAQEVPEAQESEGALSLLRIPALRRALATSALVLYSRDIFVAYFPLYAHGIGLSDSSTGWIIALQGLSMVLVRLFLVRLIQGIGRERVLLVSILAAGAAFLLVPAAGQLYLLIGISVLMGLGLGCGQPLSMSTTYNASPKNKTGEVLGLRLATNRLSQLIAPLFFGVLGSGVGLGSVFYVSGAFLIGGAILTKSKEVKTGPSAG